MSENVTVTLGLTGKELVLLYILTGNEDAGRILREATAQERADKIIRGAEPRRPYKKRNQDQRPNDAIARERT